MTSPSAKPSTKLDYFVVDVFTETPLNGNPLAVVLNTCGLTTEQMQAIAREFNLSETTFIERRSAEAERAEGVLVRIFTIQEELPFAGHPTLGTASVLKMIGPETLAGDIVTLALKVGPVPVRFESSTADAGAIFGEMTQREPEFGPELDAAEVAPLLGLAFEDMDPALPPQVVSTGAPFAIVVLRNLEALARLKVNQDAATAWLRERGARWFYVLAPDLAQNTKHQNENSTKYRARMQFYGGEDPATGSAAGCAIGYLVARDAVPSSMRVHVRQGVEVGARASYFYPQKKMCRKIYREIYRGSRMCAWQAAPFLWQKDSFSCRDAQAFNRNSSSQLVLRVRPNDFPHVSNGFSFVSSPLFPSSHKPPRLVPSHSLKTIQWRVFEISRTRPNAEHKTAKRG